MPIRLIASDMDGTLLDGQSQVSPATCAALRDAHARGILLCIASGRGPREINPHLPANLPFHYIAFNGGLVRSPGLEDLSFPLTTEQARLCLDAIEGESLLWVAFAADGLLSNRETPHHFDGTVAPASRQDALAWAERGALLKMIAISPERDAARIARAREKLIGTDLLISSSAPDNFEINAPGIDKGAALRALADRLGIAQADVMACGDYENDLAMLGWAGESVAMGNALPKIKAIAKHQTDTNLEDGVAKAIRRLAL